MTFYDFLSSKLAPIFSYTIVLVILGLMFFISLRLFINRRKKAYFSMMLSLLLLIMHYVLMFYFTISGTDSNLATYISLLIKVVSFVGVHMGIFQLYNPTRRRHFLFFNSLIAIGILISLLHFYVPNIFTGTAQQVRMLQDIGLELYLFILIFLCFYLIPPYIGQQNKYQIALTLYFTAQIAHILNAYMFGQSMQTLSFLENVLPIAYFFMLFFILFDRVVELMQAIYTSSITDGLTRLYNRKYFYNRVTQYVERGLPVSILFSDIDNFKKLNDTKGHQMGDDVLKQVAEIMKESCEDIGIAGRYGGEEMVILITDTSVKMDEFSEMVRKRIETETIVTASIGYSKFKSGVTPEQLIKQADEAMYQAKKTGKNKVVKYA
jgi:diguanylate cyclase (GGDEF)-like protein